MSINSRQKGARGERLLRDVFIEHGFPARRGQQFAGGTDSPDVIVPDLPWMHVECKFVENLNIHKAMEQATRDADGKTPIVFHKKKNEDWLVTLTKEDFFELLVRLHDLTQRENGKHNHTDIQKDEARKLATGDSPL